MQSKIKRTILSKKGQKIGHFDHKWAKGRSAPGIEPGTSSTLKTNHTPRPSRQCVTTVVQKSTMYRL
eukprot:scaffold5232_cov113-Skeletonema_dohrnii-CCMP3373.AAC.6